MLNGADQLEKRLSAHPGQDAILPVGSRVSPRSFVTAYGLAQCAPGLVTWESRHVYTAKRNLHKIERRKRKNDLLLIFISSHTVFILACGL
jgi:hypothetical protein